MQYLQWNELCGLVSSLALEVAECSNADVVWPEADKVFQSAIGHLMFTALQHNEKTGSVTRLYSSNPDLYPVGGSKAMGPTPWGDQVLKHGRPFLGRNADDMHWAFPDHGTLAAQGMQSVLNLPVRVFGKTLGTINLTHQTGHYRYEHIPIGVLMAAQLAPLMPEFD